MSEPDNKPKEEHLLVEYQAAQDSAQHHDNLVWQTAGVIWAANLVLMGFVLSIIQNEQLKTAVIAICCMSIIMIIALWIMDIHLIIIKRRKYERCKAIEKTLHFKQHSNLVYPKYIGTILYCIIMVGFIILWVVILITLSSYTYH